MCQLYITQKQQIPEFAYQSLVNMQNTVKWSRPTHDDWYFGRGAAYDDWPPCDLKTNALRRFYCDGTGAKPQLPYAPAVWTLVVLANCCTALPYYDDGGIRAQLYDQNPHTR